MVEQVLEPIRPKFVLATKAEVMLKKIDDTIDSPDPSDIERELDVQMRFRRKWRLSRS
jgi:hypothetical protein